MKKGLVIGKIIFWITITFICVASFSITLGQVLPIEFADWRMSQHYYDFVSEYIPFAILLTLIRTIRKSCAIQLKLLVLTSTLIASVGSFYVFGVMAFKVSFGVWVNESILYKNKENLAITINEQVLDQGALGYGGRRTVRLKPFLGYWNLVKKVDVSKVDTSKWINGNGDLILQ